LGGGDSLQVNGDVTNSGTSSSQPIFSLPFFVGANSVWTGYLQFSNTINIQTYDVTIAAAPTGINFVSGSTINFEISSATTYGKLLGAAPTSVSGVNINISLGAYTGQAGDTFDFLATGGFTGANLNALPSLDPAYAWDSSNFITNGTLSVVAVPEPATLVLLAGGLGALLVFRRRAGRMG
jgi:hypothetical protein